jgi:hypothetical protein
LSLGHTERSKSFDIDLKWDTPSADPVARSRRIADALLVAVPGMTEFPLDAAVIAEAIEVPVSEVWNHWFHVELHAPEAMAGALVHLSNESVSVELPSNPIGGCAEALKAVGPLLAALTSEGLRIVDPSGLLGEYEAQRARVLRVAEMVGGQA